LDLTPEQIVDDCWLLLEFIVELVQQQVQKFLCILLVISAEGGHVFIDYLLELVGSWLLVV
jgi:hypothetical protein